MNVLDVRNILNVTATANNKKATTPDMTSYSTGITVDDELSPTSKNPVQNKVVYAALQEKQDLLPSGNTGDFLQKTADGVQWSPVSGALPSQTGQAGRFLTTDGSTASWATVSSYPTLTWYTGNTGSTVTIPDTTSAHLVKIYKNGLLLQPTEDYSISGTTLTLVTALVSADKITLEVF